MMKVNKIQSGYSLFILLFFVAEFSFSQFTSSNRWLMMDDGVRLDATIFVPSRIKPPLGYPAIVFVHGLCGSKQATRKTAEQYAKEGYVALTYSVRGQGNSEGLTTVFAKKEQDDLNAILHWLTDTSLVNGERLGVSGASQGGYHAWFAAVNQMPVKAVYAGNSVPSRVDAAVRNGCYQSAIVAEIDYKSSLRLDTLVYPLRHHLLADNYDSVRAVIQRNRQFDSTEVAASTAKILMMNAWHDHVFPPNRVPSAFLAASDRAILYQGTIGHGSESSPKESGFRNQLARDFFAEHLLGLDRGISSMQPVIMAVGPDWDHYSFDSWPAPGVQNHTYYLHSDGTLKEFAPVQEHTVETLQYARLDNGYSWEDAIDENFNSTSTKFHLERTSWVTERFDQDYLILGIPKVTVYVKGPEPRFQINLQLYVESDTDTVDYLSQIGLGQRSNPDSTQWHQLSGDMTSIGWTLPTGSRLRLDWASINVTLDDETLWSYPYWDADGTLYLGLNSSQPTSIQIPLLPLGGLSVDVFASKPNDFELMSVYPNPFNGRAVISCQLSVISLVKIAVYDLVGRQIDLLVNGMIEPGQHRFYWEASGYTSGTYLFVMEAGKQRLVRKGLLMR